MAGNTSRADRVDAACRVLLALRCPASVLADLPSPWTARTMDVQGRAHGIVLVSYTRQPRRGGRWLAPLVPARDHLGLHLAVESEDGRAASWLLLRHTSSWVEAHRGDPDSTPCRRASFRLEQEPLGIGLSVRSGSGLALRLRATATSAFRSALFPSAAAFSSFAGDSLRVLRPEPSGQAATAERFRLQDRAAFEPLAVTEWSVPALKDAGLPTGLEQATLDCGLRFVERRLATTLDPARAKLRAVMDRGGTRPAVSN